MRSARAAPVAIAMFFATGLLTACDPCHVAKEVRSDVLYDEHDSISNVFTRTLQATTRAKYPTRAEEREAWQAACKAINERLGRLFIYSSFSGDLSRQIRSWSKCRVKGGALCPSVAKEAQAYADASQIGTALFNRIASFCDKVSKVNLRPGDIWLEARHLQNQPNDLKNGVVSIWGAVYELDRATIPAACMPKHLRYRPKPIIIRDSDPFLPAKCSGNLGPSTR